MKRRFLAFLLGLLWAWPAWAASSPADVRGIRVEGNRRIEAAAVLSVISTAKGRPLDREILREDVRSVFRTGYFDDVQVVFDEGTGQLTFRVKEKTVVREIRFSGNKDKNTEDLTAEVQVKPYTYLDEAKIRRDVEALTAFYEREGFYLAEVRSQVEKLPGNEAVLTYDIQEHRKVKIRQIHFIGNRVFGDNALRKVIQTKEKGFLSFVTGSGRFEDALLKQDREVLRQYYGHLGYIRAQISAPRIQLSPDKRSLSLTFVVEEGDPYRVGTVDLAGDFIRPKEELQKKVKLTEGELADTQLIQQDIAELSLVYMDEGYAYVNVIPRDRYEEDRKIVHISYYLQPGPKVSIERIRFAGNESTRDKVLRREMRIREGQIYSGTKIRDSKQNLDRLALFEEVRLATPRASADDRVDILVTVKEKSTGSFSIGAGFNTLESFQIIGQVQKRNLFGYGVDLSLSAQIGGKTQAFNLQFRDEYFLDTRWGLTLNGFSIARRYTDFDLDSRGGNLGFDYPLYEKGLRRLRGGVTYAFVDQELSGMRSTVENLFDDGQTSGMTFSLTWDTRNRVFEPSRGSYYRWTEEVAGTLLGGDYNYLKSEFDGRWHFPVAEKSRIPLIGESVFAFHLGLGYVAPLRDGQRVPLFERYFPGGIFTIRGFPIRSLGPEIQVASSNDPYGLYTADFNTGGNKQLIFNAEYIFPIVKAANIKGVFFFDMGNAFDNGESIFTLTGQRQSAGFGIRWLSPIGPLRFEWGFPLDPTEDDGLVVFDFTIGSLF